MADAVIEAWEREGKWVDPITERPFDANTKVFVFGQRDLVREGLRVFTDHFDIHVLSSWKELKGYHFDFVLCHSNGCPNALGAHRDGIIRVDHFLALGTDWTAKDFRPGELKGADLVFFVMKGDPIWKIPAPTWAQITENARGLKWSIPFDSPMDIVKGAGNLLTRGRADPDRFPVIPLAPLASAKATLSTPFASHALVDGYIPALRQWFRLPGDLTVGKVTFSDDIRKELINSWNKGLNFSIVPGSGPAGSDWRRDFERPDRFRKDLIPSDPFRRR